MAPTVDTWLKIGDDEAFPAAMRLIKEEALLVGGSSGTALAGTLKWLKTKEGKAFAEKEGANIVVLLPDGSVVLSDRSDSTLTSQQHSQLHEQTMVYRCSNGTQGHSIVCNHQACISE